jgi:hypothetical protein
MLEALANAAQASMSEYAEFSEKVGPTPFSWGAGKVGLTPF